MALVVHTFNPNTREAKVDLCELEARLVYRVSSRIVRATQRNLISKHTHARTHTHTHTHTHS